MALIKINGRLRFYSRVTAVERVKGSGKYVVQARHGKFLVEGGKAAGGTRMQWFLEDFEKSQAMINGCINCSSLVDALSVIDNM